MKRIDKTASSPVKIGGKKALSLDWHRLRAWVAAAVVLTSAVCLGGQEAESQDRPRRGLTRDEELRYRNENLEEMVPGLVYRSADPTRRLLEFLVERVGLRYVVHLKRKVSPARQKLLDELGLTVIHLPMSASRPPLPKQILELIRITLKARTEKRPFLMHCHGGADRTGKMGAIFRMLFMGEEDRDWLKYDTRGHYHLTYAHPNVFRTIELFRPELYQPFIDDPARLDDPESIAALERQYFQRYPLLSGSTEVRRGQLHAGTGKADLLAGWDGVIPMASYGPLPPPAEKVAEPVFARAILLEVAGLRVGIVACDLLIVTAELRRRVFAELAERGIRLDDLMVCATHTHTSVGGFVDHAAFEFYMFGRYMPEMETQLVRRIADAVAEASGKLVPARLGVGRAFVSGLNHNRRIGTTVDEEVGLIKLTTRDGRPLAAIVNFAGHPVLEPRDRTITPDYPGKLARRLDETHGFGMFLGGALGDLNARAPGADDGKPAWATAGLAEAVVDRLYEVVAPVLAAIPSEAEVDLGSATHSVELSSANAGLIPDLFYPLEWLVQVATRWPREAPVQCIRLGKAALIGTGSELGVRIGLRLKRRVPCEFPFVVTHANGYNGYALTPTLHAKSKLDPTSLIALNGASHGPRVVEATCDFLKEQWGERLEPLARRLSPAARVQWQTESEGLDERAAEELRNTAIDREEEEILLRADPTLPQTRSAPTALADAYPDELRLAASFAYASDVQGGDGLRGRRRETRAAVRVDLPWQLRLGAATGYVRSDWQTAGGRRSDDGAMDLLTTIERPFVFGADRMTGTALRCVPQLGLWAPTGQTDREAPFAFAAGMGVWQPQFGGALEFTWETYRTLSVESVFRTPIDRHNGRAPGARWSSAFRYRERHGAVSLLADVEAAVQFADRRRGGRTAADVDETSWQLGFRPGVTIHFGDRVDVTAQALVPVARGGRGAGTGNGVVVGLGVGF